MSNIIKFPVIAGIEITTDDQNRFNLNALHRASGLGNEKAPSKWLRNQSTIELIATLESQCPSDGLAQKESDGQICPSVINAVKGGNNQGTFAHELLAISYAGWISPKFQLQVNQTFLDYKKGNLQPIAPANLSRFDILKIAMQAEEENQRLSAEVETMKPKAEFCDKVALAPDAISLAKAAKVIGTGRNRLITYMKQIAWLTRIGEPYQSKMELGYLDVKIGSWQHPDHGLQQSITALVTGKGLVKLQKLWEQSHNNAA